MTTQDHSSPDFSAFLRPLGPDTFHPTEDPKIKAALAHGIQSIYQRITEGATAPGELQDVRTEKQRMLGALPLQDGTYSLGLDALSGNWSVEKRFSLLAPGEVWEDPRFEEPSLIVFSNVSVRGLPVEPENRGDVFEAVRMLDIQRPPADPTWPAHSDQPRILGVTGTPQPKKLLKPRKYGYEGADTARQLRERLGRCMLTPSEHTVDANMDIGGTSPLFFHRGDLFKFRMSYPEPTPAHELAGRFRLLSAVLSL